MSGIHAHLGGAGGEPHDLVEHLGDVARLAGRFAAIARPDLAAMAEVAGWLHDLGKIRHPFQQHLHGTWRGPEKEKRHAVFGAAAAGVVGLASVALAVLGHHAGLHDHEAFKASIGDEGLRPVDAAPGLLGALEAAMGTSSPPWMAPIADPLLEVDSGRLVLWARLDRELRVRMLFSCLVDADHLDTERYCPRSWDLKTLAFRRSLQ